MDNKELREKITDILIKKGNKASQTIDALLELLKQQKTQMIDQAISELGTIAVRKPQGGWILWADVLTILEGLKNQCGRSTNIKSLIRVFSTPTRKSRI